MKTDPSIYKICIAAINRHTIKPFDFQMTQIYREDCKSPRGVFENINLNPSEISICSTEINEHQWTLLTTQRIFTSDNEDFFEGKIIDFKTKRSGNFKGIGNIKYVKGIIELHNSEKIPYFLETGKASMVMIYGLQTAMQIIPIKED
ncbi:hypothetical protein [Flexithrix dorotheae]|uniref:hypothetical protein n=1 Tax=Flexithrix dorotheae TaxID=70993 RepID=UPI001FE04391|nr:hypothetical protein [Flexithrix dorotheae]